jgi:hypothetical protein
VPAGKRKRLASVQIGSEETGLSQLGKTKLRQNNPPIREGLLLAWALILSLTPLIDKPDTRENIGLYCAGLLGPVR